MSFSRESIAKCIKILEDFENPNSNTGLMEMIPILYDFKAKMDNSKRIPIDDQIEKDIFVNSTLPRLANDLIEMNIPVSQIKIFILMSVASVYYYEARDCDLRWLPMFISTCNTFNSLKFISNYSIICQSRPDDIFPQSEYIDTNKWKSNKHTVAYILAATKMYETAIFLINEHLETKNLRVFISFLENYISLLTPKFIKYLGEKIVNEMEDILAAPRETFSFIRKLTKDIPELSDVNSILELEEFSFLIEENKVDKVFNIIASEVSDPNIVPEKYEKYSENLSWILMKKPKGEYFDQITLELLNRLQSVSMVDFDEVVNVVVNNTKLFPLVSTAFNDDEFLSKLFGKIPFTPFITNTFLRILINNPYTKISNISELILKALYNSDESSYEYFSIIRTSENMELIRTLKSVYEKFIDTFDSSIISPRSLVIVCEFINANVGKIDFDFEKLENLIYEVAPAKLVTSLFVSAQYYTLKHPEDYVQVAERDIQMIYLLINSVSDYTKITDYLLSIENDFEPAIDLFIKAFEQTRDMRLLWKALFCSIENNKKSFSLIQKYIQESIKSDPKTFLTLFSKEENANALYEHIKMFDINGISQEMIFEMSNEVKFAYLLSYMKKDKVNYSFEQYKEEENEERRLIILDAANNKEDNEFWSMFEGNCDDLIKSIQNNMKNAVSNVIRVAIMFKAVKNINRAHINEELGTEVFSYALENNNRELCIDSVDFSSVTKDITAKVLKSDDEQLIKMLLQKEGITEQMINDSFDSASINAALEVLKEKRISNKELILKKLLSIKEDCTIFEEFLDLCLESLDSDDKTCNDLLNYLCSLKSHSLIEKAKNAIIQHVSCSKAFLDFLQDHCFKQFTEGKPSFGRTSLSSAGMAVLYMFSSIPFVVSALLKSKEERHKIIGNILYQINNSVTEKIEIPSNFIKYFPSFIDNNIETIFKEFIAQLPNHLAYRFGTEMFPKIFSYNEEYSSKEVTPFFNLNYEGESLAYSIRNSISHNIAKVYDSNLDDYIFTRNILFPSKNDTNIYKTLYNSKGMKISPDTILTYICTDSNTNEYVTYVQSEDDAWFRCSQSGNTKVKETLPNDIIRYAFSLGTLDDKEVIDIESNADIDVNLSMILQSETTELYSVLESDYSNEIICELFAKYKSYSLMELCSNDTSYVNENLLEIILRFSDCIPDKKQLEIILEMCNNIEETECIVAIIQDWINDPERVSISLSILNNINLTSDDYKEVILNIQEDHRIIDNPEYNTFVLKSISVMSLEDAQEAITNSIYCEKVLRLSDERTVDYFSNLTADVVKLATKFSTMEFLIKILGDEPSVESILLSIQKLILSPNFDTLCSKIINNLRNTVWIEKSLANPDKEVINRSIELIKKVWPIGGEKDSSLALALASSLRVSQNAENNSHIFDLVIHYISWFDSDDENCKELAKKIAIFIFSFTGNDQKLLQVAIEIGRRITLPDMEWLLIIISTLDSNEKLKEKPQNFVFAASYVIFCMAKNVELFHRISKTELVNILVFCSKHKSNCSLQCLIESYKDLFNAFTAKNCLKDTAKIRELSIINEPFFEGKKILATKEWIINTELEMFLAISGFALSDSVEKKVSIKKDEIDFSINWIKGMIARSGPKDNFEICFDRNTSEIMAVNVSIIMRSLESLNKYENIVETVLEYLKYLCKVLPIISVSIIREFNNVTLFSSKKQRMLFADLISSVAQFYVESKRTELSIYSSAITAPFLLLTEYMQKNITDFEEMEVFIDYCCFLLDDGSEEDNKLMYKYMNSFSPLSFFIFLIEYSETHENETVDEYFIKITMIVDEAHAVIGDGCFSERVFQTLIERIRPEKEFAINITLSIIDEFEEKVKENAQFYIQKLSEIIQNYGDNEEQSIKEMIEKISSI